MARLSRLAAWQWGLLTTAQATREGVSRAQLARLESAGVLERVDHGVYAMTAAPDNRRRFEAAWLTLDPVRTAEERLADRPPSGAVSHTSAASLHGLGDLLDDVPEVTVPGRRQTRRTIRIHRAPLTPDDVTLVDGLPTTTVERTIVDLLRDGHSPDHIAQIVGQAHTRGLLDVGDLARRLEPLARTYRQRDGRTFVAHLLDIAGATSPVSAEAAS
jgi:predicted transcriptional regulator of viral defense system